MRTAVRGMLMLVAIALGAATAATAVAQAPAPAAAPPAATAPAAAPAPDTADQPDLTPHVDPALLTERHMREPEILHAKPSGFWTSNRPAIGGAYRYKLMLLGIAIAAAMGTLMVVVIRRYARRPAA
jgi:hypothetical protein